MAIRIALHHRTSYRYDRPVRLGPQTVRLRPAPHTRCPIAGYSLKVEPTEHFLNWQQDPQNNWLARLVFPKPTTRFAVTVDLVADLSPINPFDFFLEAYAERWPFVYESALATELRPYLELLPEDGRQLGPLFAKLVSETDLTPGPTVDALVAINRRINRQLNYTIRMDPGVHPPEQTLEAGIGSCRDFAWLLVQVLRKLGLAARFVSGYSIQLVADEKPLEGPAGVAQDVVDLHAWAEVFLPGAGWVGLDATSGMMCTEGHLPLAASPDPTGASPIAGALEPCETDFDHAMTIARLHEDPRVTKPYTQTQWESIDALAREVDRRAQAADLRLTMGGEPTFVSIDDYEAAEWNTTAVGPQKLARSIDLIKRLRARFGQGGLLHVGQGKWYPGEPLPRWAMGLYWRTDGQAIWTRDEWLAPPDADLGHTMDDAQRFAAALCRRLGLDADLLMEACEDPVHFALEERNLPHNLAVLDSKVAKEEDRQRLLRVFGRGLDEAVGLVLPIRRSKVDERGAGAGRWVSGPWVFRDGGDAARRVILVPGDSPVGLRLPLSSLPWETGDDEDAVTQRDPSIPQPPLPSSARFAEMSAAVARGGQAPPPARPATAKPRVERGVVRTAMTFEPRDGVLRVFMPPTHAAEDYLELIAALEETAAELSLPLIIEGYTPPHDPRIAVLKVTPDPGVIEVNVQPARDWDELVNITSGLYDDARRARLGTEKFAIDGRHTGTGGGNHVVVGAATPLDSPWLRRPDLLKSVITYWLNHPSLSYLFSGLFIGPTSQSPRVDEGRPDAIYELEIALAQIAPHTDRDGPTPPWLVDRVFRHLLTDMTGNTHRAEVCIDKLYSPDTATGRLGLVEFRGFEMPPHTRMSLAQMLLLRAIVLMLWERPYLPRPVRWGSQLHDRFMLPHFVMDDFDAVLHELRVFGLPFERQWFVPHEEFRFPVAGRVSVDDVSLELRTAIEPWYVLGEEPAGGGMARYVDASVERLQVRVRGIDVGSDTERFTFAVNGIELPLRPTGVHGEGVCGVRFRAWQPPSCLHPTIESHSPLVFDVIDKWHGRAIGGCTYHVAHPGGRNYDTRPVNALEAEGRRKARFFAHGHTPGPIDLRTASPSPEFPYTLDLRRQ